MIEILYYEKGVKKGDIKNISKLKNKLRWIDITNITKEESEILKKEFDLHPLTIEDLFNSGIRIKVEEFDKYLFCVFYAIANETKFDFVELDFIIGDKFLITNHKKSLLSFDELKKDKERLSKLFDKGTDFLFHKLLDMEIDNFFPFLEKVDDQIEKLEETVAKTPKSNLLQKILSIKRDIVKLKRLCFAQREKISFLAKNDYKHISKKLIPYMRDIYDHAIRVSDKTDNHREAVGNAFDVYMSALSNNMNEVMKTLSIIATIALPLTVISGIYGTNFSNLPGSQVTYGFWIMIIGMTFLCIFMLNYFKRRGWF